VNDRYEHVEPLFSRSEARKIPPARMRRIVEDYVREEGNTT
jgi:hypothetical protein